MAANAGPLISLVRWSPVVTMPAYFLKRLYFFNFLTCNKAASTAEKKNSHRQSPHLKKDVHVFSSFQRSVLCFIFFGSVLFFDKSFAACFEKCVSSEAASENLLG
jgi:hypothetical protein